MYGSRVTTKREIAQQEYTAPQWGGPEPTAPQCTNKILVRKITLRRSGYGQAHCAAVTMVWAQQHQMTAEPRTKTQPNRPNSIQTHILTSNRPTKHHTTRLWPKWSISPNISSTKNINIITKSTKNNSNLETQEQGSNSIFWRNTTKPNTHTSLQSSFKPFGRRKSLPISLEM